MKRLTLLFLLLLTAIPAFSQQVEIFVNNEPFKGKTSGQASDLLLELDALLELVKINLEYDETDGVIWVEGEEVEVVDLNGTKMVPAKQIAELMERGNYIYNPQLGSVDVYLLAPRAEASGGQGVTYLKFSRNGKSYKYTAEDAEFKARWNYSKPERGVEISVRNEKDNWSVNFAGPDQTPLRLGKYVGAERFPFNDDGRAGLSFSGNGWGANTLQGEFEVLEYSGGDKGPGRIAVDFVQKTYGTTIRGQIRYNSSIP